ncbi:MAG: prepilin-type N-terminal cleavage/methylation domain-containing protein [Planctomycetes bacterium]|nr:prepilin-type N-terminal cleavage/methylation domain-containing protein [Planctomycetota bacterium]
MRTNRTICPNEQLASSKFRDRAGFSLLELLVVLSITSLLTGLLMPTLSTARESAHRVVCAAHQREIGHAISMYAGDHRQRIPVATVLDQQSPDPTELSLARKAYEEGSELPSAAFARSTVPRPLSDDNWDALGRLKKWHYCDSADCFYCPSHEGDQQHSELADEWYEGTRTTNDALYTNFQYVGHKDWRTGQRRRLLEGSRLVLATDSLRTRGDFNHGTGMNMLLGDGSVKWKDDVRIRPQLPFVPLQAGARDLDVIYEIFGIKF